MTLEEIYAEFVPGSRGFAQAVSSHCGFEMTLTEIMRLGSKAKTADEFQTTWENTDWWVDAPADNDSVDRADRYYSERNGS